MNDLEFIEQAEQLLAAVEQSCDRINDHTDADLDSLRSGGVLTISFANRSQIVVNWQKPLHEIWLAARSGGYHYRFDGKAWRDTKSSVDFFTQLSQDASAQSGLGLCFAAQVLRC